METPIKGHLEQVTANKFHAVAVVGFQVGAGGVDHVPGDVEGDDAAAREGIQQVASELTGTTAGVEDGLIPAQADARQNFLAPVDLGSGDLVIDSGVPFVRHGSSVVSAFSC